MNDLGCKTNIEVIERFISLRGKQVVDIGCGGMALTRELADRAEYVLAVDPDPVQAELNRSAAPVPNVDFQEASAAHLPAESDSMDGAFFAYSLHHIPKQMYREVFAETFRVLKPGGFLYVIEPMPCDWNEVMKLFHNEDVVRAAAQAALQEFGVPAFESYDELTYHSFSQYESFEDYSNQFASRSFNSTYTAEDVRRLEVREMFERLGAPDYRFKGPKRVMFLQGLIS